ncbi:MAG: hypothetical protein Q8937_16180 [Bacteroidota bacterium]|nr:hypothetical protein [Bacteroidota bacterium]
MKQPREKDKRIKKEENRPTLKPDPETAGKSDPQEHMKGPISSMVRKAEAAMDGQETKKELSISSSRAWLPVVKAVPAARMAASINMTKMFICFTKLTGPIGAPH